MLLIFKIYKNYMILLTNICGHCDSIRIPIINCELQKLIARKSNKHLLDGKFQISFQINSIIVDCQTEVPRHSDYQS